MIPTGDADADELGELVSLTSAIEGNTNLRRVTLLCLRLLLLVNLEEPGISIYCKH